MLLDSAHHDRQLFHIMQRLYAIANFTASGVGDVSLGEYAMLLEISEFEQGAPMKDIERTFDRFTNPHYIELLLEDKELVRRVRNRSDKRSYSCEATTKGRSRIEAIDEALAVALIGTNPNLGEDDLGVLVQRGLDLAAIDASHQVNTMFPATVIVHAFRYHRFVAQACSTIGIPPLQASLLCVMATAGAPRSVGYFASRTSIFDSIIEFQLGALLDKRLARYDGGYYITERGMGRLDGLFEPFTSAVEADLRKRPDAYVERLRDLSRYLLYLFR